MSYECLSLGLMLVLAPERRKRALELEGTKILVALTLEEEGRDIENWNIYQSKSKWSSMRGLNKEITKVSGIIDM